jgi:hypothetical protein
MSEQTITIPKGYRAVLVPDDFQAPHPDYEECSRQAKLATGLEGPSDPWLNIYNREINRWCAQIYGKHFPTAYIASKPGMDDIQVSAEGQLDGMKENGWTLTALVEPNPKLGKLFGVLANGQDASISGLEGFILACSFMAFSGVLQNGADIGVIHRSHDFTIDQEGMILGLTAGDMGFEPTGIKMDPETTQSMKDDDALAEFFARQTRTYSDAEGTTDIFYSVAITYANHAPDLRTFIQKMIEKLG